MQRTQWLGVTAARILVRNSEQLSVAGPSSLRQSHVRYASKTSVARRGGAETAQRSQSSDRRQSSPASHARITNAADTEQVLAPKAASSESPISSSGEKTEASTVASGPIAMQSRSEPETNSEFAEQDKKPLPYLSAPLGVQKRPTSQKLSWIERRDQQFDDTLRMQKRKAIVKEATRGYFHDVHAMRSHGGKTWIAPPTLIRHDRALYFPAVEGTCLSDKAKKNTADLLANKVSLICILTSQVSEAHAKSFTDVVYPIYKDNKDFQLVQINLQENMLKAALVSLFASSIRRSIPTELQSTYLLSSQDLTMEKEALALHNKHVGYTYLVGPDLKIRWAACAFSNGKEAESLTACISVLLERMKEEKGGR